MRHLHKVLYEDPCFTSAGWINENMHECFHQDADLNLVGTEPRPPEDTTSGSDTLTHSDRQV